MCRTVLAIDFTPASDFSDRQPPYTICHGSRMVACSLPWPEGPRGQGYHESLPRTTTCMDCLIQPS